MAGKYRTPRRAKKITLDTNRYLRHNAQGRWVLYKRMIVATSREDKGEVLWFQTPISPQQARQMMLAAGIKGAEE